MPVRRRRAKKGNRKQQRKGGGVPRSLKMNMLAQRAHSIETIDFGLEAPNNINSQTFQLSYFARSSAIAACYRFYKAVACEWEYIPIFNTFQESDAGSTVRPGIPQLLYAMNRTQDSTTPAPQYQLQYMESQGARPKNLSNKITVKYKPNWASPGLGMTQYTTISTLPAMLSPKTLGLKTEYGWLAGPLTIDTFPNGGVYPPGGFPSGSQQAFVPIVDGTVPGTLGFVPNTVATNTVVYNGHDIYIQQDNAFSTGAPAVPVPVCRIRLTVKWEFKEPQGQYYKLGDRTTSTITEI